MIAKEGQKLTIIMIAHRLTTIESADNLLYFKSRNELISAEKGTPEYDEIFEKLKCISYAYGDDDDKDEQQEEDEEYDEADGIIEEEVSGDDEDDDSPQKTGYKKVSPEDNIREKINTNTTDSQR